MKVVILVNTSFPTEIEAFYQLSPPLGLLTISASLRKAGFEVVLIDPQFEKNYKEKIKAIVNNGILFVGMSVFMGPNLHNAIKISKYIKSFSPKALIVWGGPLATSSPDFCLNLTPVDYVVMGMGENTVVEFADCISQGKHPDNIPYLSYRNGSENVIGRTYFFDGDLDQFEYPDLSIWDYGVKELGRIPILSSRGCPRNCAFCYNNTFIGRKKWYPRSAKNVLDEMISWREFFGLNSFYFIDDNFLVNTKRAETILHYMIENDMEISQVLGHIQDFTLPILKLLKTKKISHVGFAIESASIKIQKILHKPINLDKVIDFFKFLTELKIEKITSNFMFGLPSETDQDIAENIAMAVKIRDINAKIRTIPMIYTPQPQDDILPQFPEWMNQIQFNVDNLSKVDFSPNRSKYIAPGLRPWLREDDIEFLVNLTQTWFYHFDYEVRNLQKIDINEIYAKDKRIVRLFQNVPLPRQIT